MPQVQCTSNVGRRDDDGEGLFFRIGIGMEKSTFQPHFIDARLCFGEVKSIRDAVDFRHVCLKGFLQQFLSKASLGKCHDLPNRIGLGNSLVLVLVVPIATDKEPEFRELVHHFRRRLLHFLITRRKWQKITSA